MKVTFKNALGAIEMDGGTGSAAFKILSVEGITQNAASIAYPFTAGQKTLSRSAGARLITLTAEAAAGGVNYEGTVAAIAHDSGRLEIFHGNKSVYAQCYVSGLSVTRAKGGEYERYVFHFTCDYPYFRDMQMGTAALFQRKKLLKGSFTLPKVFSERTTGGTVNVSGDRNVYPTIYVRGLSYEDEFPLALHNETTGAELKLLLPAGEYELIIFDLREGKISCGGDLTKYLDDGSFMSDFYLAKGLNRIDIKAMDVSVNTSASVSFENEYYSAWGDADV